MRSMEPPLKSTTPDGGDEIRTWLESAASSRVLTRDEIIEISRRVQELPPGSPARRRLVNKLVKHNMRLVVHLVQKFMASASHRPWGSPETLDFLQIGCIGLMKAAEKYDPSLGYAFSTYASYWVRSVIGRYNMRTITPVHVPESAARQIMFYRRNGYFKTKAGVLKDKAWAEKEEREINLAYKYLELDRPLSGLSSDCSDRYTLADTLAEPDRGIDPESFHRAIIQAMHESGISEVGQQILLRSYVDGKTSREIGAELGIGAEALKREKAKALNQAKINRQAFAAATL